MHQRHALALGTLLLAASIAGCATPDGTGGNATGNGATGPGGMVTYTHMSSGEAESLDPAYDYETAGGAILSNVYEGLVGYGSSSAEELAPVLAVEVPEVGEDGVTYTFTLRPGVRFHDGTTLDAGDVKFSLDRTILMNDPDGPAWIYSSIKGADAYFGSNQTAADRAAYLAAGGVTVVDDSTVRVTLDHPDASFLYRLAYTAASVISKDFVCAHAAANFADCLAPPGDTRDAYMDAHEAGTGAYMLDRWQRGEFIALKRFDQYWGESGKVDRVIVKKVDDLNTRLLSLRSGEADSVYVALDHYDDVKDLPGVRLYENPSVSVAFIGFNQQFCRGALDPEFATCMTTHGADVPKGADGLPDIAFFSDIHMRKAWTYAFDYATFHDIITGRHGVMLNGVIPRGLFGHDPSIPAPQQDLGRAREELALSSHPDGFEVTIFYNVGNTVREKTSNLIKQNIEALLPGKITVKVQGLDWSTALLPKTREGGAAVYYLGWGADYGFPDNFIVTFAHSEKGVYAKRVGYHNAELEALLDAALLETDLETLETMYGQATRMLNDDHAFLWLDQRTDLYAARTWVKGFTHNPMSPASQDYQTRSYAELWIEK